MRELTSNEMIQVYGAGGCRGGRYWGRGWGIGRGYGLRGYGLRGFRRGFLTNDLCGERFLVDDICDGDRLLDREREIDVSVEVEVD